MRDVQQDVLAAGGAATRAGLRQLGNSYESIRGAIKNKALVAIGRFWVTLPAVDPAMTTALRAGGVLGGESALRSFGVWVTDDGPVHVAMKPSAGRRAAAGTQRSWTPYELDALPWRTGIVDALAQHTVRVDREHAIASIDSALHQGLIHDGGIDALFAQLPQRCRPWRRLLDSRAGSGLESLVRVPCHDRGWNVESQVPAPGGGYSDLLLDGWLYVETDGDEWHDNQRQAAKDRRRNSAITDAGGRWLRFGHADVVQDRDRTISRIAFVLAQGRPRPGARPAPDDPGTGRGVVR